MLERIRQNLVFETQESSIPENLTPAAVLFPLLLKDNNLHVLFTKRTQTVKAHKGQVSFPGGVRDPHDENLLATALREAQEEIDLKPEDVEILGVGLELSLRAGYDELISRITFWSPPLFFAR